MKFYLKPKGKTKNFNDITFELSVKSMKILKCAMGFINNKYLAEKFIKKMKLFKLLLLGNLGLFSFVSCEDKVTSANDLFGLTIKDAKTIFSGSKQNNL